jgi:hypothetical protein
MHNRARAEQPPPASFPNLSRVNDDPVRLR